MRRRAASFAVLLLVGCASAGGKDPDGSVGGQGGSGTTAATGAGQAALGEPGGTAEPGTSCADVDWKAGLDASITLTGSCDACGSGDDGVLCFAQGDYFKACGAADPPEATACTSKADTSFADECGCDGSVCPEDQRCVTVHETVSGGSYDANRCFALCQSNEDCAPGQACLPDLLYAFTARVGVAQCVVVQCRNDEDCTEDACGHCVQARAYTFQGNSVDFPKCAYAGPAADARCAGALPLGENAHVCHASSIPESYRTNPL